MTRPRGFCVCPPARSGPGWRCACELLRGQLARRGLPFGSALLVTGLANETVSACVPATIAEGVCHAAILNAAGEPITGAVSNSVAILVKGGMSSMAIVKGSKVAAVVMLLCAFAGAGVGLALGLTWASDNQGRSSKVELQVPDQKDVAKQPGQKIEGPPALDAHGDPLPPGALLRMGTQRLRHGGALKSLAWSPDGQTLAVGSGGLDFAVRLWDVATGKEIRAFEKQQTGFFQVAFSPDGSLVASVDRRGGLYLWDALTAKVRNVRKLSEQATVSFASNGKSFITIDEKGQACLLETATLKTLRVFSSGRGLQAPQVHVAWSADGKIVAAADTSDKLRLFEVLTGNVLHTLDLPGPIDHLSISPDNRLLATAGKDKIARLWNIADCNMPAELEGHTRPIKGAAWSPDSKTLATISGDKTARLWDVRTRKEFLTFTHPHAAAGDQGNIQCVAFSPDGKLVASIGIDGDNAVHIRSAQTGKEVINYDDHLGYIVGMALLDGGKSLLTSAADENIRLWNLASGKAESQLHVPHTRPAAIAVTPDGKLLAAGASDGGIRVLELPTGKVLKQIQVDESPVFSVAISPDGKTLASASNNFRLLIWDLASGKIIHKLRHPNERVCAFAFSSDGKILCTGGGKGAVRFWNVANGQEVARLAGHAGRVDGVEFFAEDMLLLSVSNDGTAKVWDLSSGKELRRLKHNSMTFAAAISSDGKMLATGSGDGVVRLWELATGKMRATFNGHRGQVSAVKFAGDGKILISGCADATALCWDLTGHGPGKRPAVKALSKEDLQTQWENLHGRDTELAYQALKVLADHPEQALVRLQMELKPVASIDQKAIAKWIADLDAGEFAVREKAVTELKKAGDVAWPALLDIVDHPPSLEAQARARQILGKQDDVLLPNSQRLRLVRSLELLEWVKSPGTVPLLQTLAMGAPQSWLTQEANRMLKRMQ